MLAPLFRDWHSNRLLLMLTSKEMEFFGNVWDHAADEFQISFDERRPLSSHELKMLNQIITALEKNLPCNTFGNILRPILQKNEKLFVILLQLIGLTRNKILQDLKAGAGKNRSTLSLSNHQSIFTSDKTWAVALPYLIKNLRRVFFPLFNNAGINGGLEALNQATWPGFIRQERAKRSGHEAEHRIALLLLKCGVPFEPIEKVDNPLCRDIQVHGVSFDIVVPSASAPLLCVKSTVHTANIGQYGESKDHLEVSEARQMIDDNFTGKAKPILLGFIDGIGFKSNRAGLLGVLDKTDEFCQFKTIWKLVIIAAAQLHKKCEIILNKDTIEKHKAFLKRYHTSNILEHRPGIPTAGFIEAGEALVVVR